MMEIKKIILSLVFLMAAAGFLNPVSSEAAVEKPVKTVHRKHHKPPHHAIHHGTATWYSRKDRHIHRHTASGEVFDDSKFTCAAWDVPLGTHLKVTNLQNQKTVVCRVNDRGPSKRLNRSIDLTRTAFQKIASPDLGVIPVSVAPVNFRKGDPL